MPNGSTPVSVMFSPAICQVSSPQESLTQVLIILLSVLGRRAKSGSGVTISVLYMLLPPDSIITRQKSNACIAGFRCLTICAKNYCAFVIY
jgi:hypothetical protein